MKHLLIVAAILACAGTAAYSQKMTGVVVSDSGKMSIYGKYSCCLVDTTEQFRFDNNGGFFAGGNLGIGTIPMKGKGYRTMWYPNKGAFRSGYADNEWDDAVTGFFSWAGGSNSTAQGLYSFSFGDNNYAGSTSSIAFGSNNKVYGAAGFAAGSSNVVEDTWGVAFGTNSRSRGLAAAAIGYNLVSKGYASTVVGMYNDSLLANNEDSYTAQTPLFMVGNGTSNALRSNALVVRKDGRVAIGDIVPSYILDVADRIRLRSSGNNTAGLWLNNPANTALAAFIGVDASNNSGFYGNSGAGWGLVMNSTTGNVGIGTQTPSQRLTVNGSICYTGSIAACSDIRYKTNIFPVSNALLSLLAINPIYYNWKTEFKDKGFTGERQIGFSAQEVEKLFPEMVQTDGQGYKALDYSRMAPVLVEAIKEQQLIIEKQEKDIIEFKKTSEKQQHDIDVLKEQVAQLLGKK
jgi:hypothetical protein